MFLLCFLAVCILHLSIAGSREDPQLRPENSSRKLEHSEECKSLPFPHDLSRRWVLAENAMNGLSNQLFGIYSYIPVAILWNSSLVIGDVYSRGSFEVAVKKYEGWNSLPFSSFFDYEHFSMVWRKRGIDMILLDEYKRSCIPQTFTVRTVTREPHFWPNKDAVINKMLEKSKIPLPIPENTVVKFDDTYPKFTALYNFWKGGLKNKMVLLRVHRSLRPAPHIQDVINAVRQRLPETFLVAHIRLEGDYLLHENVSFENGLEQALSTLAAHPCLQHERRRAANGILVDAPALYVASGLFNSSVTGMLSTLHSGASSVGTASSVGLQRAQLVLQRLQKLGFRDIFTRESLLNDVILQAPAPGGNETALQAHRVLVQHIRSLVPEQAALVDLSISRASTCFLSSHYASSFSYMAQRLRSLDRGQVLRYPEITDADYGVSSKFKQWGV